MSLVGALRLLRLPKVNITPKYCAVPVNGVLTPASSLGKIKKKKGSVGAEKLALPVETDVNRLVNYCCGSNIFKEGEDVKLKPDSEYPDWLWTIRTGPAPTLEELDPNTKKYWRKVRKMGLRRNNLLASTRRF